MYLVRILVDSGIFKVGNIHYHTHAQYKAAGLCQPCQALAVSFPYSCHLEQYLWDSAQESHKSPGILDLGIFPIEMTLLCLWNFWEGKSRVNLAKERAGQALVTYIPALVIEGGNYWEATGLLLSPKPEHKTQKRGQWGNPISNDLSLVILEE